jgi:hypothetical protein
MIIYSTKCVRLTLLKALLHYNPSEMHVPWVFNLYGPLLASTYVKQRVYIQLVPPPPLLTDTQNYWLAF